jgi:hypothetical protein
MNKVLLYGLLVASVAVSHSGCRGCDAPAPKSAQPAPAAVEEVESAASAAASATKAPPNPAQKAAAAKPAYRGPSSRDADGYQLTMGFADDQQTPRSQPVAMEGTHFFVTVLDPQARTMGALREVGGRQLRGYLVARDMRQVLYAEAVDRISPGADARDLRFRPREGGDHALITAFSTMTGGRKSISSPIVIKGGLPEIMGPGVVGLGAVAKFPSGEATMLPSTAQVGAQAALSFSAMDLSGTPLPPDAKFDSVVVYDDAMGRGSWLPQTAEGAFNWTPQAVGPHLVLAVLRRVDPATDKLRPPRAVAFKIDVTAPEQAPAAPPKALEKAVK